MQWGQLQWGQALSFRKLKLAQGNRRRQTQEHKTHIVGADLAARNLTPRMRPHKAVARTKSPNPQQRQRRQRFPHHSPFTFHDETPFPSFRLRARSVRSQSLDCRDHQPTTGAHQALPTAPASRTQPLRVQHCSQRPKNTDDPWRPKPAESRHASRDRAIHPRSFAHPDPQCIFHDQNTFLKLPPKTPFNCSDATAHDQTTPALRPHLAPHSARKPRSDPRESAPTRRATSMARTRRTLLRAAP